MGKYGQLTRNREKEKKTTNMKIQLEKRSMKFVVAHIPH
jgi:hypothetical protein